MMHSLLVASLCLLNHAESVVFGGFECFVLLATINSSLHELVKTFDFLVSRETPDRWIFI